MTVPANRSGDKLIRDYLARVTEASLHYLPKGDRAAFVGRTRARIEREAGEAGLNDPGRIMAVLAAMGEPEELVRQERARLDHAWTAGRARSAKPAEAAPSVSAPREHRRLNSRWRPATVAKPLSQPPAPRSASGLSRGQPGGQSPAEPVAVPPALVPGAAEPTVPGAAEPTEPTVPGAAEPPVPGAAEPTVPGAAGPTVPGAAEPPWLSGWAEFARRIGQLARSHPLETAAVVLLGFGGLIFPILPPVWLLGALLALPSRVWDQRDKWVAFAGPFAFAAVLTVVVAAIMGGHGNVPEIYGHAFRLDLGYVVRLGCVASAGYLAWRVYKGPRVRVPPWRR